MKRLGTLILLALFVINTQTNAQRYLTEVFDEVTVTTDVTYGQNVTVITVSDTTINAPTLQQLVMDVYEPAGDTENDRPLIINIHTGNFLPQGTNGGVSGVRTDSITVELATRFARMGYVVANIDYRLGWNPLDPDAEERRSGLINAAYRGIQDSRTAIRFFKQDALDGDNTFGVCPDNIGMIGNGTGGYVVLGAATINNFEELLLPKFFNANTGFPMVIEEINGDPFAIQDGFLPLPNGELLQLCVANFPEYDSDFDIAINMGGALGDTSWMTADDRPIISFQVPDDPFAPYLEGDLIVPTTGEFVVEVQGAGVNLVRANDLGLNDVFIDANIDDDFTTAANAVNGGLEGLYPVHRPCPPSFFPPNAPQCEASPWEWWDFAFWGQVPHPSCPPGTFPDCNFSVINANSNQMASPNQGRTYADTIIGYSAPRIFAAMELDMACQSFVAVEEVLNADLVGLSVAPNPATTDIVFSSNEASPIETVEFYNLAGQLMRVVNVNGNSVRMDRGNLIDGIYFAKVRFEEGIVTQKIIFN